METTNGWMDLLKRTYELFLAENKNLNFNDFQTNGLKKIKIIENSEIILISDAEEDNSVIIFYFPADEMVVFIVYFFLIVFCWRFFIFFEFILVDFSVINFNFVHRLLGLIF
jgi:hypothetical protein